MQSHEQWAGARVQFSGGKEMPSFSRASKQNKQNIQTEQTEHQDQARAVLSSQPENTDTDTSDTGKIQLPKIWLVTP
jgi:hypothetical protein